MSPISSCVGLELHIVSYNSTLKSIMAKYQIPGIGSLFFSKLCD